MANERGNYGSNGQRAFTAPYWAPPQVGISPETKVGAINFGRYLITTLLGGWVGYSIAGTEGKAKGFALGVVGGAFASYIGDQRDELREVNRQLRLLRQGE